MISFLVALVTLSPVARSSSVTSQPALERVLDADYAPVRNEVLSLLRRYPPDQYYYLSIGRCLTPAPALLQEMLGPDSARNVPFSQLMHFEPPGVPVYVYRTTGPDPFEDEWAARQRLYTPEILRRFEAHLAHFLPNAGEVRGRTVLVLDWSDEGRSIVNLSRELKKFAPRAAPDQIHRYEYVALTAGGRALAARLAAFEITARTVGVRARRIFGDRRYRAFAEYDEPASYVLPDPPNDLEPGLTPSIKYAELRAAIGARAARDPLVRRERVRLGLTAVNQLTPLDHLRCACDDALSGARACRTRAARAIGLEKFGRHLNEIIDGK